MNQIEEWVDDDGFESEAITAVLGGVERGGCWTVPRRLRARAILGGIVIDLRKATFLPGLTELEVFAVLGDVTVIVPAHVSVESEGTAILGCFEHVDAARFAC